jgi:hypothetical protein
VQYTTREPGVSAIEQGVPTRPTLLDQEDDLIEETEPGYEVRPAPRSGASGPRAGTTEVIEDYYEQP